MIDTILAATEAVKHTVFSADNTVLLLVYAFVLVLIIIATVIFIRFLSSGMREMKMMRMEVGKLAEELRLLRHDLKGRKQSESSTQ